MKNKSKTLITLLTSIFILVPTVEAADGCGILATKKTSTNGDYCEINKQYNDYYFFLWPPTVKDKKIKEGTTTEFSAAFPAPLGREKGEISLVKMGISRPCSNEEECWTYQKFYEKWDEIAKSSSTNENTYSINGKTDNSKSLHEGETTTYHLHGSYSINGGSLSQSSYNCLLEDKDKKCETYRYATAMKTLICATVTENVVTELKNKNNTYNDTGMYLNITRTIEKDITNIEEKDVRKINSSNCDGNIYSFKVAEDLRKETSTIKANPRILIPALYKYSYNMKTNSCFPNNNTKQSDCNSSASITDNCGKLTIKIGKGGNITTITDVSIEQSGTITNILTPTTIHQGGGLEIGFMYYNTSKWKYIDENNIKTTNSKEIAKKDVTNAMKGKLKTDFANSINAKITLNYEMNDGSKKTETIDNSNIKKKCNLEGKFTAGNTMTTICTLMIPKTILKDYTGEINVYGTIIAFIVYIPIFYSIISIFIQNI